MKRIALFIGSLQKGGSERVMVNLAEYLHQKNYEVILVTQYKREDEYEISPSIRRVFSEPDEMKLQGNRIQNFIARFQGLRDIWKAYDPDVILSFLGKNNLMAIATAMFLPVRVAVSVRGEPTMEYEGKKMQAFAKVIFALADGVILQTKQCMDFFPKYIQKKAVILPNPINEQFLDRQYDGEKENFVVAVGRVDENKNHKMLIHAFEKIASEYPQMRLVIYGDGNERENLQYLVEEKGLSERISLPGNVKDVASYICQAKVYALTSNTEGMPNSLIEAMALGLPVISTKCPCGGPEMLIRDGENGLLIPVGDENALADALRRVLSDSEFAYSLGENAKKIAEELHPDKVNSQWEQYLIGISSKRK